MLVQTPSGVIRTVAHGRRWSDGDWHWTGTESAETLAAHGYIVQPDPEPVVPTLAEMQVAALARYQAEAGDCLRTNLPSPWDTLRDVATPEFQAWADEFCALVATELTRLEAAVTAAADAAALAAIVGRLARGGRMKIAPFTGTRWDRAAHEARKAAAVADKAELRELRKDVEKLKKGK